MAKITVSIKDNISKSLKKLEAKLQDMTPVFKDIADYEWSQTRFRYVKQIDPRGNKWPDPFTIRRGTGPETGTGAFTTKRGWDYVVASNYKATPPGYRFFDPGRGDKILRDTGTLFNSIGRAYGKDYAVVGTNVSYAKKNQEGQGKTKARPFLGINAKTVSNIKKTVKFYIMGATK